MKKYSLMLLGFLLLPLAAFAGDAPEFDQFFTGEALRLDYYHTGDAAQEFISVDQLYRQPQWSGHPGHLIDRFNNGRYYYRLYDLSTNRLIFSRGFDSYFGEYKTTQPALDGVKRTYHETALLPYPRHPVRFVLEVRGRNNLLQPLFSREIDPADYHIIRENRAADVRVFDIEKNGDPRRHADIAFIAEGYTAEEAEDFREDAETFRDMLFGTEPYKSHRKQFNIYGVFRPSAQSGTDEPRKEAYRHTALNAGFNALDLDRYLLTEDNKSLRDIASAVPYDAVFILVNSNRYGGGGIYHFYGIGTAHNRLTPFVFLHEFGHSFSGLGDEYYSSQVSYSEFYPTDVEPTPPNITALLQPENLKWKALLSPGIELPTGWNKAAFDSLRSGNRRERAELRQKVAQLKKEGASPGIIREAQQQLNDFYRQSADSAKKFLLEHPLRDKVGAFEGAGYLSRGLYRPMLTCIMFSNDRREYCRVCRDAIVRMIEFYAD